MDEKQSVMQTFAMLDQITSKTPVFLSTVTPMENLLLNINHRCFSRITFYFLLFLNASINSIVLSTVIFS